MEVGKTGLSAGGQAGTEVGSLGKTKIPTNTKAKIEKAGKQNKAVEVRCSAGLFDVFIYTGSKQHYLFICLLTTICGRIIFYDVIWG